LVEPIAIQGGYARVPDGPGLGIEVDEAALIRFKMEPPYELPKPHLLLSVIWPDGRVRHYTSIRQCWTDAQSGSIPAQERGVMMEVRADDGSPEWAELYARAERGPVVDQR
jgi:hypothetical protein